MNWHRKRPAVFSGFTRAVSQLLWPHKGREEWFSLGENHERRRGSPDFLRAALNGGNDVRLSLRKGAHAASSNAVRQEIRESQRAFRGFLPRKTTPREP